MTREEAVKYIKSRCIGSANERDGTKWSDAMWTAIEALSNADQRTKHIESVELISKQDAIDAMRKALLAYEDELEQKFIQDPDVVYDDYLVSRLWVQNGHNICLEAILSLPSADAVIVRGIRIEHD